MNERGLRASHSRGRSVAPHTATSSKKGCLHQPHALVQERDSRQGPTQLRINANREMKSLLPTLLYISATVRKVLGSRRAAWPARGNWTLLAHHGRRNLDELQATPQSKDGIHKRHMGNSVREACPSSCFDYDSEKRNEQRLPENSETVTGKLRERSHCM